MHFHILSHRGHNMALFLKFLPVAPHFSWQECFQYCIIVLYCIDGVVMHNDLFKIYCAPPNLLGREYAD